MCLNFTVSNEIGFISPSQTGKAASGGTTDSSFHPHPPTPPAQLKELGEISCALGLHQPLLFREFFPNNRMTYVFWSYYQQLFQSKGWLYAVTGQSRSNTTPSSPGIPLSGSFYFHLHQEEELCPTWPVSAPHTVPHSLPREGQDLGPIVFIVGPLCTWLLPFGTPEGSPCHWVHSANNLLSLFGIPKCLLKSPHPDFGEPLWADVFSSRKS